MGTTLTGTTPQDTYDSLIKVTDNGPLSGSLKTLTDGLGNDSALALSTAGVGIGTTSGTSKANILSATVAQTVLTLEGNYAGSGSVELLEFNRSGGAVSGAIKYQDADTAMSIGTTTSHAFLFNTGNTEKMRITSTGDVGIGTSSPAALLHVSKASAATTLRIGNNAAYDQFIYFNGNNDWSIGMDYSNSNAFVLSNASSVGTNDRLVVTTTGNVGIGTSSPAALLSLSKSADASINVNTSATGTFPIKSGISFGAATTALGGDAKYTGGAGIQGVNIQQADNVTDLVFWTTAGGSPSEKVRVLSGGGITFNGDTAAANALDDYEEGTWTMSLTPSSSGTITLDSAVNAGSYTKIGRQVTLTGLAEVLSVSSPVGTVLIVSGLPFAIGDRNLDYDTRIGGSVTVSSAGTILPRAIAGFETQSSFNIYVDTSTIAAGNQILISFTYIV